MAAIQVTALLDVLSALGVDSDRVCAQAGLTRSRLRDPAARVPAECDQALWDAAIAFSGDPALSLRVAERFVVGDFGSFEYLIENCSNLAEMVELANKYMAIIDDLARLELRIEDGQMRLRLYRVGGFPIATQGVECVFALLVARSGASARSGVSAVRFTHVAKAPLARYEAAFGCRVHFGASENEIVGDPLIIEEHWPGDPRLRAVLEEHAHAKLASVPRMDPFIHEVREQLLAQLGQRTPDVAGVARALGMSERSFRRRLRAAGSGYQEVLDTLRAQLAKKLFARADVLPAEVAERLGFADTSTLYRCFKRWTGMTPAQYRESLRSL